MKHSIDEIKFKNGARGLFINVPGATVMNFDLNFRAGYYLVDRDKWEVPHLMEHMVLGANKKYPKSRIFQAEFEKNGAYSNASTGTYDINYIAECADFEWDRIAGLLKTSIEQPLFLKDEYTAELGNIREELTGDLNNNFRRLVLEAREKMGLMVMPDAERLGLLDGVNLSDVTAHYKNTHTSDNLRFLIAGKITPARKKKLTSLIESLSVSNGERFELPDEKPSRLSKANYIQKPGIENLYFLIHTFSQKRLEPEEEDALVLLNVMLTTTLHSKILGEAREKGLVYHMSSNYNNYKLASEWWFGAQVMPDNVPALFEIIHRELNKILTGKIDAADIQASKQYSLGKYQRSVQTVQGLLRGYAGGYYFEERIDDFYDIPNRIKAVSKKRMVDVAKTMFSDKTWGLHVLGTSGQGISDGLQHKIQSLWE